MSLSKILVADDNKITLKLIKKFLESNSCEVYEVSNGEECIAFVEQLRPDLILLDVMMPRLDGYSTIKILKSNPKTQEIPVIIFTALNDSSNQSKSIQCGADDFLGKPLDENLLIAKVKIFTEIAQLKERVRKLEEQLNEVHASPNFDYI